MKFQMNDHIERNNSHYKLYEFYVLMFQCNIKFEAKLKSSLVRKNNDRLRKRGIFDASFSFFTLFSLNN